MPLFVTYNEEHQSSQFWNLDKQTMTFTCMKLEDDQVYISWEAGPHSVNKKKTTINRP